VSNHHYSLYEAKANLSKIVRQIREGGAPVVITVHGEPAVEIRAYQQLPDDLDARWAELEARGVIARPTVKPADAAWKPVAKRRGALKRFLADRDDG
jgi:prevent-host-death family protein